jgi:cytochrome c5
LFINAVIAFTSTKGKSVMKKLMISFIALFAISGVINAEDAPGKVTYDTKCAVCHASGVAGAPKLGDKEAWAPRIATGMDALVKSSVEGKNAMPPKGTCMDCSDADLKAAVEYMTAASK